MLVGAGLIGGALWYQIAPRDKESSSLSKLIGKYSSRAEHWEETNARHTKAEEQAGYDRNLFENAGDGQRHFELTYPEYGNPSRLSECSLEKPQQILIILTVGLSDHTHHETFVLDH
jgi:hypothetical protein